jgi:hypothetical protein
MRRRHGFIGEETVRQLLHVLFLAMAQPLVVLDLPLHPPCQDRPLRRIPIQIAMIFTSDKAISHPNRSLPHDTIPLQEFLASPPCASPPTNTYKSMSPLDSCLLRSIQAALIGLEGWTVRSVSDLGSSFYLYGFDRACQAASRLWSIDTATDEIKAYTATDKTKAYRARIPRTDELTTDEPINSGE